MSSQSTLPEILVNTSWQISGEINRPQHRSRKKKSKLVVWYIIRTDRLDGRRNYCGKIPQLRKDHRGNIVMMATRTVSPNSLSAALVLLLLATYPASSSSSSSSFSPGSNCGIATQIVTRDADETGQGRRNFFF